MQSLADKTREYWVVSSIYNGSPAVKGNLATDKALQKLGSLMEALNPQRPLFKHTANLQYSIIMGGSKASGEGEAING